jgi:hypothetical protein
MIAVFGGHADVERDLIQGRIRAKMLGQHMGHSTNLPTSRKQRHAAVVLRGQPPGMGRQLQRGQSDDFTVCGISNAWPLPGHKAA